MCLICTVSGSTENYRQDSGLEFLLGQALQLNAVLVPCNRLSSVIYFDGVYVN